MAINTKEGHFMSKDKDEYENLVLIGGNLKGTCLNSDSHSGMVLSRIQVQFSRYYVGALLRDVLFMRVVLINTYIAIFLTCFSSFCFLILSTFGKVGLIRIPLYRCISIR